MKKADTLVTSVLVICAVITTALVVRREFFSSAAAPAVAEAKPTYIENWRDHLDEGARFGSAEAPVQMVEFADFECPFCASFYQELKTLRERYPKEITVTYVDFPLPMHRFAEPASRAAECAGQQGRLEDMHEALFRGQRDFGLKPWSEFATVAGVQDAALFEACIKSNKPLQGVAKGKALGEKLNVRATPTLIINGWKMGRPPTLDELDAIVKRILAGEKPV